MTAISDSVSFGSVVVLFWNDEERTYQLVAPGETDVGKGRISWESPLARALLGNKVGIETSYKLPNGSSVNIKIKTIKTPSNILPLSALA